MATAQNHQLEYSSTPDRMRQWVLRFLYLTMSFAFYVFPDISHYFRKTIKGKTIENASDFALYLLEEAHVATVSGEAFGCPNNIRISYAASMNNIKEAVKRIQEALT